MKTIKRIVQAYIRLVQKLLITAALVLLYVFGFGCTTFLMIVFCPGRLFDRRGGSLWKKAEGYICNGEECSRES